MNDEKILGQNPKKLPQYKGKLTAEEVAAGINAARQNAKRLFHSAEILFANGDYATSVSLAILAIEESGKSSILRGIAVTNDNSLLKNFWKDYRSHEQKTKTWNILNYIPHEKKKVKLEDFIGMFSPGNISSSMLDQIKQIGFYTDCLGKRHWSIPQEVIDKSFAKHILDLANFHCGNTKTISIKEIELWVECLAPVWMKSLEEMKHGLLVWRRKMHDAGLIDDSDRFAEFITTGINLGNEK